MLPRFFRLLGSYASMQCDVHDGLIALFLALYQRTTAPMLRKTFFFRSNALWRRHQQQRVQSRYQHDQEGTTVLNVGLIGVPRNLADFTPTGVDVLNPWDFSPAEDA